MDKWEARLIQNGTNKKGCLSMISKKADAVKARTERPRDKDWRQ